MDHVLQVGDVEMGGVARLLDGARVDAVYADPPWNAGIATRMRQWAGDEIPVDFGFLMQATADAVTQALKPCGVAFLQMGVRGSGAALLEEALAQAGLASAARPCATIASDAPAETGKWARGAGALIIVAARTAAEAESIEVPTDLGYTDLCRALLRQVVPPGGTVLDCFLGKGMTLRVCDAEGWSCYGMELNAKRLSEALQRVERDRAAGRASLYEHGLSGPSEGV